ncbi:acetyltransferase (GNAT) family domain-containing protein [Ditylenchus destructor]|nr:acetyltransferase (GNAT) family domain-containing protein [Ditylenchus destructor]
MYFTLLAVVLLFGLTYIEAKNPGCTIEEESYVIKCVKGSEVYGRLEYAYGDLKFNYENYYDNPGKGSPNKSIMIIENISVEDPHKGNGVGSALMDYFIKKVAQPNGVRTIELYVPNASSNAAAVALYRKFGFTNMAGAGEMVKNLY